MSEIRTLSPLLAVDGLVKHFHMDSSLFGSRHRVTAVHGINFSIQKGETLGLVGESGSGKSTVARCVMQLERPSGGRVVFDGHDLTQMSESALRPIKKKMQIVFQDPYSALNPRMAVGSFVSEPIRIHQGRISRDEMQERVSTLFRRVGLDPIHMTRYPHEFSGGQRQRVGIARALAMDPQLIIADEPITALDVSIQAQIVNLLQSLQEEQNIAYLFISHDLGMVRHLCHRVAVMLKGRIVETGPAEAIFHDARHPYTQALISATLEADPNIAKQMSRKSYDTRSFLPDEPRNMMEVNDGHFVMMS